MSFYEHFFKRERNPAGVRLKIDFAGKVMELARRNCREMKSVLEIGPGDGYIAELSKQAGYRYKGIEASGDLARALQAKGFDVIQQFVPPLPPDSEAYSACVVLHVMEHMDDYKKASKLLADIQKRLHQGGVVIIACPDYYRWGKFFWDCDYTHRIPFTRRTLNQLLINEGYEVVFEDVYVGKLIGVRYAWIPGLMKFFYGDWMNRWLTPHNNLLYRLLLTFLPNLLMVARKP